MNSRCESYSSNTCSILLGRNRWQQRKENNSGSSSPRQQNNQWNNKMAAGIEQNEVQNTYQNRNINQQPPRFNNQNQNNQGFRQNNFQKQQVPFPSPNVFESMGNYQGGYNNGYQNGYNSHNQNGFNQRPYNSKCRFFHISPLSFVNLAFKLLSSHLNYIVDSRNGGQQYRNNNSNGNKSGGSGSSYGSPPPHFATPQHYPQMHPHHQEMLGK